MDNIELKKIIEKLVALPRETEWVEFKENFRRIAHFAGCFFVLGVQ